VKTVENSYISESDSCKEGFTRCFTNFCIAKTEQCPLNKLKKVEVTAENKQKFMLAKDLFRGLKSLISLEPVSEYLVEFRQD
jgi:hypothetical protein